MNSSFEHTGKYIYRYFQYKHGHFKECLYYTDIILDQMSSDNWMEDYGENLKESIISNLSLSRNKILE